MQARPPVAPEGRSGEDPALDVLDSGSAREPRLTAAARRRLRLGSVAITVSVAAVAGGVEVQERRVAAAEERRSAGPLQLSADGPRGFGLQTEPPPSLSAVMVMEVMVRNDGPRDVTVTQASAGGFVLLDEAVPLPAQTTSELVLHQELRCSADTAPPTHRPSRPPAWPGPLQITARTSRGTRTLTLERPPYYHQHSASLCEWLRNARTSP